MGLFEERTEPVLKGSELRQLIEQAMAELEAKTTGLDALIHFNQAHWSVDQDKGTIVFDQDGGMHAAAPVQIIGTYNSLDSTWLWAWDHPSIDESLRRDAGVVREYGREHNIPELITRKVLCQETDCWEFTALACKLCDRQGAYRGPSDSTRVFMTFGTVKLTAKD